MKSMGMQIKPKREYFCYAGHRIQSALREVWGLKGVMKILVPVSERERARALTLVDPPWPSQFPGAHSWLFRTQAAPPLESRR